MTSSTMTQDSLRGQEDTAHLRSIVESSRLDLSLFEDFYKDIHANPELPKQEARTASRLTQHLKQLGFSVQQDIGGHGVVGVLENGPGQRVMLRSEMDGLPILEQTGLPFASTKYMDDEFGIRQPVSHACGHDLHMASLLAALTLLKTSSEKWHGTVIGLFQPNEEYTGGAQAMIDGGLYTKIPVPHVVLGQHIVPLKSGLVATRIGPVLPSADALDIRVYGDRGPGVNPQNNIEPIGIASKIVARLEELPARFKTKPPIIVGCRSFHAGEPRGDYVAHADLNIDVKTYDAETRKKVLDGLRHIIEEETSAAGVQRKARIDARVRAPITDNSPVVIKIIEKAFSAHFKGNATKMEPDSCVEDFSILATAENVPYAYWNIGGIEPELWDDANKKGKIDELVPDNHSPFFAPLLHSTLKTGTDALALAALAFLA